MDPIIKSMQQPQGPDEHLDRALSGLFAQTDVDHETVTKARAAGMSWLTIFQVQIRYGRESSAVLAMILAAQQQGQRAAEEGRNYNPSRDEEPPKAQRRRNRREQAQEPAPEPQEPGRAVLFDAEGRPLGESENQASAEPTSEPGA
jgi:hypothetical protein